MSSAVLAAVQRLTPKPRGVHMVTSMVDGIVRFQVWDSKGKMRAETTMTTEWFGSEAWDAADAWLDLMDPLPTGPQLVR